MFYILLFIKSTIIISFISILLSFLLKKKIGIMIPISFCLIGMLYYFSGLIFNSFSIGRILVYVLSLIGLIILIVKRKDLQLRQNIATQGLISFVVLTIIVFVYCYKYRLYAWDEYSHWGPMVKTMFINNSFYTQFPLVGGDHIEYPPFLSLIELFYCNLYGFYSDSIVSISLHITEFSFIIPVIFDIYDNKKRSEKIILSIFIVLLIILLDVCVRFRSIYIDAPIALLSAYPVLLLSSKEYRDTKNYLIPIIISLMCIIITKQIGIAFVLCDLFLLCYYIFVVDKKRNIKNISLVILSFVFIFAMYYSWNNYVNNFSIVGQFNLSKIVEGISSLQLNTSQIQTIERIKDYLINRSILKSDIKISFIFYILISICIYIAIGINNNHKDRNETIGYFSSFILSNAGYILLLIIIYCFTMNTFEMETLNSIERYLSSITTYNLLILSNLVFKNFNINNKLSVLLLIGMFLLSFGASKELVPRFMINEKVRYLEYPDEQVELSNYINEYIEENANILILSDLYEAHAHLLYLTNNKCNYFLNSTSIYDSDFLENIINYNYVIFEPSNMNDYNNLLSNYCNTNTLFAYKLYQIILSKDGLKLVMMS